jgi:hypothetical protein
VVHAIFAVFEDPDAEGYSDTLLVTPQAGLADPRPQPPDSFRNKALLADTVTLLWNELPEHDSLYYLLYHSPLLQEFTTYEEFLDAAGHEWDPTGGDLGVHPVRLDSATHTFYCDRDGETRSYRIIAFVDSVLSYPSEILEIEHYWQPCIYLQPFGDPVLMYQLFLKREGVLYSLPLFNKMKNRKFILIP